MNCNTVPEIIVFFVCYEVPVNRTTHTIYIYIYFIYMKKSRFYKSVMKTGIEHCTELRQ